MIEKKEQRICPNCHCICLHNIMNFQEWDICRCQLCGHERLDKNINRKDDVGLFKKKKKSENNSVTQEIIDLINTINTDLHKKIDAIEEEKDKLHRIVKYSSDKPTYRFEEKLDQYILYNGNLSAGNTLWMYIDKEEYKIYLNELNSVRPDKTNCNFEVKNNLAYFNIVGESRMETQIHFNFVIDYKEGKYVVETKVDGE